VTPDFLAPSAQRDLDEAVRWLARESEARAHAFREAALHAMRRIVERPRLGSLRPTLAPAPYRFWRVTDFPYLVVYNAARTPPLVLHVLHMKRNLPPLLAGLADLEPD
jgi:plasmid stabilization system protein ParE